MVGKTKDGVFYFYVRYTDAQGNKKQKKVENRNWKTRKETKAAEDLFLLSASTQTLRITVDQLFQLYREENLNKIKLRSITTQNKFYSLHIQQFFGKLLVSDITNRDILKWQNYLLAKRFSNNYSGSIQQFFRTILNFGVKYRYISQSPFVNDFVVNHEERKEEMMIWTIADFNNFISYVEDPVFEGAFMVLYWCGLRKGEMMALQVKDINFDKLTITVSKTYDIENKVFTTPKTNNSFRTVQMTEEVRDSLLVIKEHYSKAFGYDEDALMFGFSEPISSSTLKRFQERACIKSGVKIIRIHDLRHSHVSLLISMGFNAYEVAKRLGHTVDMVNNVYAHLFLDSQIEMVDRLQEASRKAKNLRIRN